MEKNKVNKKNYGIRLDPDLMETFQRICSIQRITATSEISKFIQKSILEFDPDEHVKRLNKIIKLAKEF